MCIGIIIFYTHLFVIRVKNEMTYCVVPGGCDIILSSSRAILDTHNYTANYTFNIK